MSLKNATITTIFIFFLYINKISGDCVTNTSNFQGSLKLAFESVQNCNGSILINVDQDLASTSNGTLNGSGSLSLVGVDSIQISNTLEISGFSNLNLTSIRFSTTGSVTLSNVSRAYITGCVFLFYPPSTGTIFAFNMLAPIVQLQSNLYVSDCQFRSSFQGIYSFGGVLTLRNLEFHSCEIGVIEVENSIVDAKNLLIENTTSLYGIVKLTNSYSTFEDVTMRNLSALVKGGAFFIGGKNSNVKLVKIFIYNYISIVGGGIQIEGGGFVLLEKLKMITSAAGSAIYAVKDFDSELSINILDLETHYTHSIREGGVLYADGGSYNLQNLYIEKSVGLNGGAIYLTGTITSFTMNNATILDSTSDVRGGVLKTLADIELLQVSNTTIRNSYALIGGSFSLGGTIQNFVLQSVWMENTTALLYGGGIDFDGSVVNFRMEGGGVEDGSALYGGGIRSTGFIGNFSLFNTSFESNRASDRGGAVYMKGFAGSNVSIEKSTFSRSSGDSSGGALHFEGPFNDIQFKDSTVAFSSANLGGGVTFRSVNSNISIIGCTVSNNVANESYGGGIYVDGKSKSIQISGCSINNNRAIISGGGIYISSLDTVVISSSSIGNNRATSGGGVRVLKGTDDSATLTDSTMRVVSVAFLNNSAVNGTDIETNYDVVRVRSNSASNEGFLIAKESTVYSEDKENYAGNIACPPGLQPAVVDLDNSLKCQTPPESITNLTMVLSITGGLFLCLCVGAAIPVCYYKRRINKQKRLIKMQRTEMEDWTNLDLGAAKRSVLNLDEFKDMEEIGAGAFGIVFKAQWRELIVAVKQMRSVSGVHERITEFLREVAILQKLRPHPNVVLFLGITIPPQRLSLITEFCHGGSLYDYLRQESVTDTLKFKWILGIAKGMLHLHLEGVIHRDLAVRNILLTKHLEVKVSDFGLSREQDDASSENVNVTTSTIGPLKWMAPESILRREYSNKSDVFSFGVVIWEILTCQDPWTGMGAMEAALAVTNNGERLPIYDGFDEDLAILMKDCWMESPELRPNFERICSTLDGNALVQSGMLSASQFDSKSSEENYNLEVSKQSDKLDSSGVEETYIDTNPEVYLSSTDDME